MKKIVIEKDIKHVHFKNVSLNKKQIRYKTKTISLEVMKSIKYHSAVLMIKDIYLMIHNIQSYYKINHWFIRQRAFIEI